MILFKMIKYINTKLNLVITKSKPLNYLLMENSSL